MLRSLDAAPSPSSAILAFFDLPLPANRSSTLGESATRVPRPLLDLILTFDDPLLVFREVGCRLRALNFPQSCAAVKVSGISHPAIPIHFFGPPLSLSPSGLGGSETPCFSGGSALVW